MSIFPFQWLLRKEKGLKKSGLCHAESKQRYSFHSISLFRPGFFGALETRAKSGDYNALTQVHIPFARMHEIKKKRRRLRRNEEWERKRACEGAQFGAAVLLKTKFIIKYEMRMRAYGAGIKFSLTRNMAHGAEREPAFNLVQRRALACEIPSAEKETFPLFIAFALEVVSINLNNAPAPIYGKHFDNIFFPTSISFTFFPRGERM